MGVGLKEEEGRIELSANQSGRGGYRGRNRSSLVGVAAEEEIEERVRLERQKDGTRKRTHWGFEFSLPSFPFS